MLEQYNVFSRVLLGAAKIQAKRTFGKKLGKWGAKSSLFEIRARDSQFTNSELITTHKRSTLMLSSLCNNTRCVHWMLSSAGIVNCFAADVLKESVIVFILRDVVFSVQQYKVCALDAFERGDC